MVCVKKHLLQVPLGLVNRGDVIGEAPEEQRHAHGAPHVGQRVEQRVSPVSEDADQRLRPVRKE